MFFVSQYLIVDIFLLMVSNQTDCAVHTHSLLPRCLAACVALDSVLCIILHELLWKLDDNGLESSQTLYF
jgi:hypothetical protein